MSILHVNSKGVRALNKDKEIEAYLRGELDGAERLKYEIAGELGILDRVLKDGWTTVTADGSLAAHYENTILITEGEPELLTPLGGDL